MILRTLSVFVLLLVSASIKADGTSLNFNFDTGNVSGYTTSGFTVLNGSVSVEVSAWSDSAPLDTDSTTSERYDGDVTSAKLAWYENSRSVYGWSVENTDEQVLNGDESHGIDNGAVYDGSIYLAPADLDMVLLEFSEAVVLEGFDAGWQRSNWDQSDYRIDDAGIVSLTESQRNLLGGSASVSWDDILYNDASNTNYDGVSPITIGSDGDQISNWDYDNGWYISGAQTYDLNSSGTQASQYWLIGMFNEMVNCDDLDGFKLLGVTARTTEVSEPASVAAFLVGLTMLFRRQQKQLKI